MNKDELLLQKRVVELSNIAYQRDVVVFSDFLNLNELNILHSTPKNLFPARYETYGGYEFAERQMVTFLPDALYYECEYPLHILKIAPLHKKFAEPLSHRDYLGALMNLGLERSKMGDLLMIEDGCILFVQEKLSAFVLENLTRVRHTNVLVQVEEPTEFSYTKAVSEIKGTVPSIRLDTIISVAFPTSRSKLTGLIEGQKVYVNGKLITSNGYRLKDGDMISIRGLGKISYTGILSETKKGRYYVSVKKYV